MFMNQLDKALSSLDYQCDIDQHRIVVEGLVNDIDDCSRRLSRLKTKLESEIKIIVAETAIKLIQNKPNANYLIESDSLTINNIKYIYNPYKNRWIYDKNEFIEPQVIVTESKNNGSIFLNGKRVRLTQLIDYKNSIYG